MYTLADFKKEIKQAIGKDPDSQLVDTTKLINRCLQQIWFEHPWFWRRKHTTLASTNGSNALASLPADFYGVHVMHVKSGMGGDGLSMLSEIIPLHAGQPFKGHSTYRYHIETTAEQDSSGPAYAIKIFPAASADGVVDLIYLNKPTEMASTGDYAGLPPVFDVALVYLVRATALLEDGQPEGDAEMARYRATIEFLKTSDAQMQSNYGGAETAAGGEARR